MCVPNGREASHALLLIMCVPIGALSAQTLQTRRLDLATAKASDTVQVKPGRYQFEVVSLSPAHQYVVAISTGRETIPPIATATMMGAAEECPLLKAATDKLQVAKQEKDVPALKTKTEEALAAEGAKDECKKLLVPNANKLIAATDTVIDETFDLGPGDYLIVDVSRMEGGKATEHWARRFTTGARGSWRATYGYAFPFFRSWNGWKQEGQQLYSRKVDSTRFVIASQRSTKSFDALPSIMFTYAPATDRWLRPGVTAGIGTDITKGQLMTGLSLTFWSNLQLAAGVAAREEEVPTGRYAVGDTVKENLDSEQLKDKAYRARPFLSLTLRLDKNPFKQETAGSGEQKKPEEKPEAKKKPAAPSGQ